MRRTKIIATIGPASADPEVLGELLAAGVDVVRVNLSHGSTEDHQRYVAAVREAAERCHRPFTGVLFDTRGPEVRVGRMPDGGLRLEAGSRLRLIGGSDPRAAAVTDPAGIPRVPVNFTALAGAVRPGDELLLDDGNIILAVEEVGDGGVLCRVTAGGTLLTRKKVTFPRPPANLPALTPEDLEGVRLAVDLGVDFVAASFVRTAADVLEVRRAIEERGGNLAVIAKIENAAGVEHIEEILEVADGLMVARGDLGVEMPSEEVPILQKRLIAVCNRLGKPAITATQMLESMVAHPRPTRAEASDVANAIFDGTDAVMLSAETATGRYPVEAVRFMARIAERADRALAEEGRERREQAAPGTVTDAISLASCNVARGLGAGAILTATHSGHTARMVARHRPPTPVIAATPFEAVARRLSLVWGVTPVIVPESETTDRMMDQSLDAAVRAGLVEAGTLVVITAGVPVGVAGTTNLVQVTTVASVLAEGMGIGRGSRTGLARVAAEGGRPAQFAPGDVLVAAAVGPELMDLVAKAGALVVEAPGMTSDSAVAALHHRIPAVVGVEDATGRIRDGELVTVDAGIGRVYRGRVSVR
ncbi:MAG TPA: pyruvate kinase [Bacillota bacterium]